MPQRRDVVLFLCGINLAIIQFLAVRNMASILFGTEVVVFLVTLSYFSGFSAGYFLSDRLGPRALRWYGLLQWATHLTLPFSLRWIAGFLSSGGHQTILLGTGLFLGGFWLTSFYSVLLPSLLKEGDGGEQGFVRAYGVEVAGAISGTLLIFVLTALHPAALLIFYQASFTAVLGLLLQSAWIPAFGVLACTALALFHSRLDGASIAALYRAMHGLSVRSVLSAVDTPYQRVEVLELEDGGRHLYLDGIRHFGSDSLSAFNYFIAGLPSSLLRSPEVVIVGSGSFEAVRLALPRSESVTSIEIDPAVAEAGERWFAPSGASGRDPKWRVVFDDAKHHLARRQAPVDLIAMDIAGPFQRQVALLYTLEFYRLIRSRLKPGGLVAVCLNGDFAERAHTASRVARTLLEVFPQVFVLVRDDGRASFAYAGTNLSLTKEALVARLVADGQDSLSVLDRGDVERHLEGFRVKPISLSNMDIVLRRGLRNLKRRYFR